jgi:hypothetical protein
MHIEKNNPDSGFPTWEEINAYLSIEPEEIEKIALIERIRNNKPSDLAGEGLQKFLHNKGYHLDAIRTWILEFEPKSNAGRKMRNTNFYIRAMAAVLLLAIAIAWFLGREKGSTKWRQYYTTDPGMPIEMGGQISSNVSSWSYHYRTGFFESALSELNRLTNNDTIHFYRASCYFELGRAKESLSELAAMQSTLQGRSVLLKAFCYWSLGDEDLAKETYGELCYSENSIASRQACFILTNAFKNEP